MQKIEYEWRTFDDNPEGYDQLISESVKASEEPGNARQRAYDLFNQISAIGAAIILTTSTAALSKPAIEQVNQEIVKPDKIEVVSPLPEVDSYYAEEITTETLVNGWQRTRYIPKNQGIMIPVTVMQTNEINPATGRSKWHSLKVEGKLIDIYTEETKAEPVAMAKIQLEKGLKVIFPIPRQQSEFFQAALAENHLHQFTIYPQQVFSKYEIADPQKIAYMQWLEVVGESRTIVGQLLRSEAGLNPVTLHYNLGKKFGDFILVEDINNLPAFESTSIPLDGNDLITYDAVAIFKVNGVNVAMLNSGSPVDNTYFIYDTLPQEVQKRLREQAEYPSLEESKVKGPSHTILMYAAAEGEQIAYVKPIIIPMGFVATYIYDTTENEWDLGGGMLVQIVYFIDGKNLSFVMDSKTETTPQNLPTAAPQPFYQK